MSESIANRDAAFECLDIAKAALRAGDHARAEKFSQKALKLYRCQQVGNTAEQSVNQAGSGSSAIIAVTTKTLCSLLLHSPCVLQLARFFNMPATATYTASQSAVAKSMVLCK
jgi:hypothetical protein